METRRSEILTDDIVDQTYSCMHALVHSFNAARVAVRLVDQETDVSVQNILKTYKEDLEQLKFWIDYVLEKTSCSSFTDEP